MINRINARLAEQAEEFARTLDDQARVEGTTLVLGCGARVWTKGDLCGQAEINKKLVTLIELAAHTQQLTREKALEFCQEYLKRTPAPAPPPAGVAPHLSDVTTLATVPVKSDTSEKPPAPPLERAIVKRIAPKESYLPDIHRLLPQSADAEQGVLCSFLLAPHEVGTLCAQKDIRPGMFHIPAHVTIFEMLQWMHGERLEIDLVTLTQQLRDQRKLDAVGGAAFITHLFMFLPTAANVSYYIEIIEEKWTLREMIRVCTEYAGRCYDEQAEVTMLLDEVETKIKAVAGQRVINGIGELLAARKFDVLHPPPQPVPVFRLGNAIIATPGNLLVIQAKAKAGKSAFLGAMIAAAMGATGDTLGVVSGNPKRMALVHFDTEQAPYDHHVCMMRALTRADLNATPVWVRSYRLADLPLRQRLESLRMELTRASEACGGIFAVILDGIADYCADPNDSKEAFALVDELHQLAIRFNCVIACVLHENPGSEIGKTRGHLGSQLERKAETNLRLEKDSNGVTVVFADRARHAHIPKDKGVCFAWSDEKQMHASTDAEFKAPARAGQRAAGAPRKNDQLETAKHAVASHFANGRAHRHRKLLADSKIQEASFSRYWKALKLGGLIVEDKAVKGMWSASAAWATEIAQDFGDDEEAAQ
jgi:hypothetical protein